LWNSEDMLHIYKDQSVDPVLNQMNLFQLTHLFLKIHFNIILPVLSSVHIFQLSFFMHFSSLMHAVGPTPLTLILLP
jgi:hypothetical protein